MHKRIILVGPSASGKNFIREKFREKGYKIDCSYTSRAPRPGEIEGIDYHFIGDEFVYRVSQNEFYEYVQYGDKWYGTGMREWKDSEIFIMETDGVKAILPEDRKDCFIIYINTPVSIRYKRMQERDWDENQIAKRIQVDLEKFKDFKDYDLQISSESLK